MTPKKLDNKSADGRQLNLEALYALAPSCFTEVQDPLTGEMKRVVNFDTLRTLLGDDAVEADHEMYQFTWPGKQAARLEAASETTDTLRPVPEESLDWDTTENIYIEGDNLRVLKLLQRSYLGKVKMIYIDPPYNTGNDFVYHDRFARSAAEEDRAAGNIDAEGIRYRKNTDSNGRFHSDWCSMMLSRLLVAHSLLSEDGVIFISIDDNEVHNLRKICDEVFGERNFVAEYKWNKTATPPSLSKKVRSKYESILCYEKQYSDIQYNGGIVEGGDMPLLNDGNTVRKVVFPSSSVVFKIKGEYSSRQYDRVVLHQGLSISNGKANQDIILEGPFKWTQETIDKEISEGTSFVIKSDKFAIRYIRQGERIKRPSDVISKIECGVGTNEDASKDIETLFGKNIMSYPKPVSLIEYLIPFAEISPDSLILDFFSGSGTTAHAVMQLNAEDLKAGKEGKRKYICVQLNEATPEDSEARKAGYASIPEIAKERIRRAGKNILETLDVRDKTLDVGFRVFKLDSSNYEDVSQAPSAYNQAQLDLFLDNIKTERTELDLLFGAMLSWGVPLSLSQPMQTTEVDGCTIYNVNDGDLVACFAEAVTEAAVRAMAAMLPERVLFRDSCFAEDKMKINLFELFKQTLDWDEKEALDNIRVI